MQSRVPQFAFVLDARLSKEKKHQLARTLNTIRHFARVEVFSDTITENELLKKLGEKEFDLVFAPWYRYIAWMKIEGFYGLTRTSGPTFIGYFADQVLPYELGDQTGYCRMILLDFLNLSAREISNLVRILAQDKLRSGILPLLEDSHTPVYYENWNSGKKPGDCLDTVFSLPEIQEWSKRSNSIRICLNALWSLVYEEGPGKAEIGQPLKNFRASFQVGLNSKFLGFRLCYTMAGWSPKNALQHFWPDPKNGTTPSQLLLRFCDFFRVHTLSDTHDIEISVGFFPSQAAEKAPSDLHTFWIEPLAPNIVTEATYIELESPLSYLKHLKSPTESLADLKKELLLRDEKIKELRLGGVGFAHPPPTPDIESILDALEERIPKEKYDTKKIQSKISQIFRMKKAA